MRTIGCPKCGASHRAEGDRDDLFCGACGHDIDVMKEKITSYWMVGKKGAAMKTKAQLAKEKMEAEKQKRRLITQARHYYDFRRELKKENVKHRRYDEVWSNCWCGVHANHSVKLEGQSECLLLCTEHFKMWFKLPDHKKLPKTPQQRKRDRLARKEADPNYTPTLPFDEWGEREIKLNCQFDPPLIFTGKKIAEKAIGNAVSSSSVMYLTVYQQTEKPKAYFVSITTIGNCRAKRRVERSVTYWVEEVSSKKEIPAAFKKYIKSMRRPRGDWQRQTFDDAMRQLGETIRMIYKDLKMRVAKDALQITDGKVKK